MMCILTQSCMSTYASSQDDIYYETSVSSDYYVNDITVVIRYGTPYYYDGYLSYYYYNGWYYYPYYYNDYWYFRPYHHAFRPGYRPRIHYRPNDMRIGHRYGFSRPSFSHRGLPRQNDRRFGSRNPQHQHPQYHPQRPRPNNPNINVKPSTRPDIRQTPNRGSMGAPARSSSGPSMRQNAPRPSTGSGNARSGRFGGRR